MKRGARLRVIDATQPAGKARKLPFKVGDTVTLANVLTAGPDGTVELKEHRGYWRAARFEPVEA